MGATGSAAVGMCGESTCCARARRFSPAQQSRSEKNCEIDAGTSGAAMSAAMASLD